MARFEKIILWPPWAARGFGRVRRPLTTPKREGDTWILNGEKRWIGNARGATFPSSGRDVADSQVKGFIVENKTTPGFSVERLKTRLRSRSSERPIALRTFDCRKRSRLRAATRSATRRSWGDTLRRGVDGDRMRDGRLRSSAQIYPGAPAVRQADRITQLVQDLLAKMRANITASQCLITPGAAAR
jgi:glutaryl-CoA dehydrogenase